MSDTTTQLTEYPRIGCICWEMISEEQKKIGLKFDPRCTALTMVTKGEGDNLSMKLRVRHGIPLVRTDGSRRKRTDPVFVMIKFCPFCGTELL